MDATGISERVGVRPVAHGHVTPTSFWALTLGSIGVVYGDIGTSPLYALKESLAAATAHAGHAALTREMVVGVVSLILWALIIIVTLKYVVLVLRADNNGEGGTLSLVTLAQLAFDGCQTVHPHVGVAQRLAPAGRDLAPGAPTLARVHPYM